MRLAIVTQSRARVGGAETYVEQVLPGLVSDAEVAFFAASHEDAGRGFIQLPPGVTVFDNGGPAGVQALGRWRPDVLFAHGLDDHALEAAALALAPAVFVEHTYQGLCISASKTFRRPGIAACQRAFGPACLALYLPRRCGGASPITMVQAYRAQSARRAILGRCAAIVTLSEHMKRELVRNGLEASRVHVVPPFARVMTAAPRSGDAACRLLFLGRLEPLKGADRLIAAMPLVARRLGRPVALTLAGDGSERGKLETLAAAVTAGTPGVSVRLAGWADQAARTRLLSDADALVVPSLWPEPFGLVGIEAAALGVPAVAFATGGIPEWLVDGETGCLAPSEGARPDALASAIVRCVVDPGERGRLAAGARHAAARRTLDAHVGALKRIFRSAAGARPLPA